MSKEPLIRFENISKSFGKQKILDKLNLEIHEGEITTLIGKSGTGKTVVLKHIVGLLEPDEGRIFIRGKDISFLSSKELALIRKDLGYLFQNVALFDAMTVFDNIALPLRETSHLREKEIQKKVLERLKQLDISQTRDKYPSEISGGMQKRVGLARVLVTDPSIILFDEPTTGLDPIRKNAVHSMISHMQKKFGFTGIMVSHEIPDVFYISQRIIMLDNGQVIANTRPEDIEEVTHPVFREFVKGAEPLKDELTGLTSKQLFSQKFCPETGTKPHMQNYSLLLFKIAQMEQLNETHGFVMGQKVVRHLARFVETYLPHSEENSRFSDDTIVSILPNVKMGMAEIIRMKLSESLKDYPKIQKEGVTPFECSVLVGVVESIPGKNLDHLLTQAAQNTISIGTIELK